VGGGYLQGEHQHSEPDGRSFFVLDMKTGAILWEYYYKDNISEKEMMRWGLPASPAVLDMDKDGFIDKVYIGDLGGNMWVFNVSADDKNKKSNSLWSGRRLYDGTSNHPIYYQPAVALDKTGTPWVYWGTGDREDPTNKSSYDRFYGVKDDQEDGTGYPYRESNLTDVTTTNTFDPDPLNKGAANKGWYIRLEKMEKVLARPAAFSGIVYFTTFTPGDQKECRVAGTARLYFVEFRSGGGATTFSSAAYLSNTTSARYKEIGDGLASAPVISVDSKGRATVMVGTTGSQVFSQQIYSQSGGKQLLYWREHTGATP
jgi:type IV pilus assembly protein PilY1